MKEFFEDLLGLFADMVGTSIAAIIVGLITLALAIPVTMLAFKIFFKCLFWMLF